MIKSFIKFVRDIVVITAGVFLGQLIYTWYMIQLYIDRVKEFYYM